MSCQHPLGSLTTFPKKTQNPPQKSVLCSDSMCAKSQLAVDLFVSNFIQSELISYTVGEDAIILKVGAM